MARRRRLSGVVLTAGLVLATGANPAAGVEPAHEIRLLGQRFTPPAGVPEAARQAIGRRAEELRARGKERLHLLVQLHELPSPAGRQELARQGLDLGAFVPGSAFIAAVPVGRAVAAVANPRVRWATLWEAGHKLHPRIVAGDWAPWARNPARPEKVAVMLLLHHDVPLAAGPALAGKAGGVAMPAVQGLHGMTVWLPQARVAELAAEEEVLWIEEAPPPLTPTNDGVRSGLRAGGLAEPPYGLDGSGVRLFVFDGGSVRSTHQTFDPGTGSRVTVIDGRPASTHATHVAGTAAGDGSGSAGSRGRGVAPGASVLSAGYQQTAGSMLFWDNAGDIEADYASARTIHGADLGTNSLGSNTANNGYPCEREGDYGVSSSLIDGIVHGANAAVGSPVLMTWSAGNERNAGYLPGLCGSHYGTTAPPACAKNPIHVGAVNSDGLSMTEFSGWGPCDDGRLKPTVVAPGCETGLVTGETYVHSSTAASDASYGGLCGTSMATPAVAGAAALLVEAWREQGYGGPNDRPSPALIKALLLHTARDLGPEGPDYIYGYGAVDAKAAVDLVRGNDSFTRGWITGTLEQGGLLEHYMDGPWQDTDEAKLTLVWDDPAAAPFAAEALVNDLTLEYSTHLNYSTPYKPWVLNPASPHLPATTGADSRNNVEQIAIRDAPASDTLIRVIGTRVPQGPQSYALVFSFNPAVADATACTTTSSTFETGTDGWTLSGAARTLAPASGHGAESVRLGGAADTFHEATRQLAVPNEPRAELTFWSYMTTEENLDHFGFGFDPFTAEIRDQAGAILAVVDLRNDGWPQGRWIEQRVDLKPWAGQTITVAFTATNDFDAVTTFWVDDVAVTTCPKIVRTSTAALKSIGSEDGWVAESSETSGSGGTVTAGDSGNSALRLGDTSSDAQSKIFVSFDLSTLPANATVVAARLRLRRGSGSGTNPYTTHGSATVDVKAGGFGTSTALAASDFQAPATAVGVGTLSNAPAKLDWSEAEISAAGIAAMNSHPKTQFRIAFTRDDDDDLVSDYIGYYGGAALKTEDRPQLIVTYTVE